MTKSVPSHTSDIIIVGGGMVGLAAALMAADALPEAQITVLESYAIALAEKPFQPSFDARSTAISGGSVDILEGLGVWPAIAEHAMEITEVQVSDKGHVGATAYSREDNHGHSLGFVVENTWLGQQLISAVLNTANISVIAPAEVSHLTPLQRGAKVTYRQGEQEESIDAQLVMIADGADSPLRQRLGMEVTTHDYQQHAVIANVAFDQPNSGVAFERFTADGPLALLPLTEKSSAVVWTRPKKQLDETMAWSDSEFMAQLHQAFGFRLGRFTQVSARQAYPLRLVMAQEQVRSGIVLLGNAAHFLHPVAGQGFNLAMRDCRQLMQVLVEAEHNHPHLGDLSVLQTYLDRQLADQQSTVNISHGFIQLFANERFWMQGLRNLGLLGMELLPTVKRGFFAQMMGKGLLNTR